MQYLDLDVSEGEMFVLLGPSGCGKTTLLRAVAGLQAPHSGSVTIDGQDVYNSKSGNSVPPEKRPVSMVFQSYALWPHMSVAENVAFPLREGRRGVPRDEVAERVTEVLEMLGLSNMRDRPVTTLSGGQQQRVALARALALRPRLLLMDEPLSNLDYELQVRLRGQVKELVSRIGVTTLYVTHNQNEALEMADRLAVMDAGKFRQIGSPRELYHGPSSEFVARFIGDMNLLPARIAEVGPNLWVDTPLGRLRAGTNCIDDAKVGQSCLFGVRQEDIEIGDNQGADNIVSASVDRATFSGDSISYQMNVNGTGLQCRLHRRFDVPPGRDVLLRLPVEHCLVVPTDGQTGAS
ncbi:ATP-binding cassette domain-containing protein [Pelagibacterium limicola]|uniref:ATP-binding cassette domain-containing protein n=1 Tax=Pelagibacterium limicola TaxID=2791022 RepID=UPI0018AFC7A2